MTSHDAHRNPHSQRLHIVLVPGFGGFDMLGQMEYYAGVTQALHAWLADAASAGSNAWGARVVLHYFNNLPTAGVRTRADHLQRFLAKRVMRNQIQQGDRIALIGHSTGGLDIRTLLLELSRRQSEAVHLRGGEDEELRCGQTPRTVTGRTLLDQIARVVFLSVPQRGTNLANWAQTQTGLRRAVFEVARSLVDGVDARPVELWHRTVSAGLAQIRHTALGRRWEQRASDLLLAVLDANAEAAERHSGDPVDAALGRKALADINLWLSHTDSDFLAIEDVACREPEEPADAGSPGLPSDLQLARAKTDARERERVMWREFGIKVKSYATVSPPPACEPGAPDQPGRVRTMREVLARLATRCPDTGAIYQASYSACAAGPFHRIAVERVGTSWRTRAPRTVAPWENDGIVNTASMLWPDGEDTLIVESDHGDIIGHFGRNARTPTRKSARAFHRYDILQSASGFDDERFCAVWSHIFQFCASAEE